MNKTVNINLGGMPFQIDDEAFDKLNAYLSAVKRKFSQVQGNNEIVEDIEARIAEMFQENLNSTSRTIVSMTDVEGAIEAMGKPEEFEQGFEEEESTTTGSSNYKVGKKLFRDPDDKVLGGVLSGLSQYFGLESPTWLRVFWLAMPFLDIVFAGISTSFFLLTYVILWIAVPKAKTATQKMQMRGEPVNLENIERSVASTFDGVKKNLSENGSARNTGRDLGHVLGTIAVGVGKVLLALFLFVAGMFALGLIITFFFGAVGMGAAAPFLSANILGSGWMSWVGILGILLLLFAPLIFLIFLLLKLLFKTKINMPAIAFGTLGAFILGIILTTVTGVNLLKDFSDGSTVKETANLQPASEFYLFGNEGDNTWKSDDFTIGIDEALLRQNVELQIVSTRDSLPSLIIHKKAKGRTFETANQRASAISYSYNVDGNNLTFNEELVLNKKDLWRFQSVDAVLRIPENTVLHFDESVREVLDEAKIHGNHYHSWELVEKGSWKYENQEFFPIDVEGNRIIQEPETDQDQSEGEFDWDDENTYIDVDEDPEHVEVKLFGKEVFELDVAERHSDGKPKKLNIKIGDKKAIEVDVDEDGEVTEIDEE